MKYTIIPSSEMYKVIFTDVNQTNSNSCRFSVDKSEFLVSYHEKPSWCVWNDYTEDEIKVIMKTEDWTLPIEL